MGWEPRAVVAIDFGTHGGGFAWMAKISPAVHFFPGHAAVRPGLFRSSGPDHDYVREVLTGHLSETRLAALADIAAAGVCAEGEIRWCITIPAIWDEPQKTALRQAACDAGLPADEDRLLLLIEPEAAALYCQLRIAELAAPGQRFVVVNCGASAVDIAAYTYSGVLEEVGVACSGTLEQAAHVSDAEALLETLTADIAAKVEDELVSVRRTCGHGPETIVVVGGLALSDYVRAALDRRFGGGHRVLAAPDAARAVLEGAAHYTRDPRTLAARRSRHTYGFAVAMPWEAGVDSPLRRFRDNDERMMCRDRFAVAIRRMDRVAVDEPVTIVVEPAFTDSREVTVQLFKTCTADPRYTDEDGCVAAGELTVDVSATIGQAERPIALLLYFGRSQLQVEAIDLTTNKKFETPTGLAQAL